MDTAKVSAKSIRELIRINFERMISFDRASRVTIDEELKSYFEKKRTKVNVILTSYRK